MKYFNKKLAITLASIGTLATQSPVRALDFNFTFGDNAHWGVKQSTIMAGKVWSDVLQDEGTINIHIDFADSNKLPTNVLGGAIPSFVEGIEVSQFVNNLEADRTSSHDNTAFDNLPVGYGSWNAKVTRSVNSSTGTSSSSLTSTQSLQSDRISLTQANAKALGIVDPHSSDLDGVIIMSNLSNNDASWLFNYANNNLYNQNDKMDLTSVMLHEIGHVLGFVSGLDQVNTEVWTVDGSSISGSIQDEAEYFTSLDLFRRSSAPVTRRSGRTTNAADFSYGKDTYLSLDNGVTKIADVSTGAVVTSGGDNFQASHWKNGTGDLMDPTLTTATRRYIDFNTDLKVLDAIGYDLDNQDYTIAELIQQSNTQANVTGNTANADKIDRMFNQRGYGGYSRSSGYRQEMALADYLSDEGLFQVQSGGVNWSTFAANSDGTSVPEPTSILTLLGLGFLGFRFKKQK